MSQVDQFSEEEIVAVALAKGLVYFVPNDNELFIDADIAPTIHQIAALAAMQSNGLKVVSELVTVSNGGKRHIYMRLARQVTIGRRIALQAACGSDPIKEALSVMRLECGSTCAVALFETPAEAGRVQAWREAEYAAPIQTPESEEMPF